MQVNLKAESNKILYHRRDVDVLLHPEHFEGLQFCKFDHKTVR